MRASAPGFAPAKVNLYLHVAAVQADGYHPLVSLMAFADVGDRVRLAQDGEGAGLRVEGPFAAALAGEDPARNLVWRAALALLRRASVEPGSLGLVLEKALPVASGLGGGSSDAGAALKLVRAALGLAIDDAELEAIAATLGADGPACLWARPVVAEGRGERLSPAPPLPVLPAVLVNPGVACSTAAVYRAFDARGGGGPLDRPAFAPALTAEVAARALAAGRNDLEPAAIEVAPEIAEVLDALCDQRQTLLARLSGSGATAFALCASETAARELATEMAQLRPRWWVRACRLGGPWPEPGPPFTNP